MALPGMDRPPLPGPDIQSQMGMPQDQGQTGGVATMAQRNTAPGPMGRPVAPGAPNPHGFLMAQVDAVRKVLEQAASAEPVFAPFAQRAISILDTGVSAVSTAPSGDKGTQQATEPGTGGPTPPSPGNLGVVPALA